MGQGSITRPQEFDSHLACEWYKTPKKVYFAVDTLLVHYMKHAHEISKLGASMVTRVGSSHHDKRFIQLNLLDVLPGLGHTLLVPPIPYTKSRSGQQSFR